jgi:hypothetical protein
MNLVEFCSKMGMQTTHGKTLVNLGMPVLKIYALDDTDSPEMIVNVPTVVKWMMENKHLRAGEWEPTQRELFPKEENGS